MDNVKLYRQLLGLRASWTVERVELDIAKQRVEVHVGHAAGQRFACLECGRDFGVYDHFAERAWRLVASLVAYYHHIQFGQRGSGTSHRGPLPAVAGGNQPVRRGYRS